MVQEIQIDLTISPSIHTISNMEDDKTGAEFEYEFANDYKVVPANTVFTSTTEHEIKVDFGIEAVTIPKKLTHEKIGGIINPNVSIESPRYTRTMQVGVMMSLPQAENIARHIMSQIEKFKARKKS